MVSYAHALDSRWRRLVIRTVESVTGGWRIARLYKVAKTYVDCGWDVWDSALDVLRVRIGVASHDVAKIPESGPLLVIANHPFGLVDGVILCHLVAKVRSDYKILLNNVLEQVDEIKPYILPVDFRDSLAARRVNARSAIEAKKLLHKGGVVIIFPSGGISTSARPFGEATDSEWKTFTAKRARVPKTTVLPVYFHGQNSRLFQIVSRFSQTLRYSLLVKEFRNQIGREIAVKIGEPLPPERIAEFPDHGALTRFLRATTYRLKDRV